METIHTRTRFPVGLVVMATLAIGACSARQAPVTEIPDGDLGRFGFVAEAQEGLRMTGILSVTRGKLVVTGESNAGHGFH